MLSLEKLIESKEKDIQQQKKLQDIFVLLWDARTLIDSVQAGSVNPKTQMGQNKLSRWVLDFDNVFSSDESVLV